MHLTPSKNAGTLDHNTELAQNRVGDIEEDIRNLQKDLALKASINEVLTLLDQRTKDNEQLFE